MRNHARRRARGQALVEFSLAIVVFLVVIMAVFDLGKGIYMYNGVSQAAREIARVTSVHPGSPLGTSAETLAVINAQKGLIPHLGDPTILCYDIDNTPKAIELGKCRGQVKVTIAASYSPITPILGLVGPMDIVSTSSMDLQ
jgi:hypothetical protein